MLLRRAAFIASVASLGCFNGLQVPLVPPSQRLAVGKLAAATATAAGVAIDSITRDSTTLKIWGTFTGDSGWTGPEIVQVLQYAFTHDASSQQATCIAWEAVNRGPQYQSSGIAVIQGWVRVIDLGNGIFRLRGMRDGPSLSRRCFIRPFTGPITITTSSVDPTTHTPGAPNQRLELTGRHGPGSIDSLMISEAAVESFHSLLPARRPQLKRGR